jgi:hypothetical protein
LRVLIVGIVRYLVRYLASLVLIIAVLLLARLSWSVWDDLQSIRAESFQLSTANQEIRALLRKVAQDANARAVTLKGAGLAKLDAGIDEVDKKIAQQRKERQQLTGLKPILAGESIAQVQLHALKIDGTIGLLQQERNWLQDSKKWLQAEQGKDQLERLRLRHVNLYDQWKAAKEERDSFQRIHPVKARLPFTAEYQELKVLESREAQLLADNQRAKADYDSMDALVKATRIQTPPIVLPLPPNAEDPWLNPIGTRLDELRKAEMDNWVRKLWRPVHEILPTALLLLVGAILAPSGIKALFYFVLAPLAASRPPMRLLPTAKGFLTLETGLSSVSRAVTVDSVHELLVHPEFLQSSSKNGEKTTQWLLNWRFPLTNLSAGMVALTRIRCNTPETFVISATSNALSEIGVLDLPAGSALVMQPHNLVGVIQARDTPLRITAHWQLTSLHAWLTLQLRYLVLHGPARLVVQGCRGIRLEPGNEGRAVNQAATIAFSANLPYSTHRCETFTAYWRGQKELLNDCFGTSGHASGGFFVYEELPNGDRKAGITGRGLEGLTDSILKVFGI